MKKNYKGFKRLFFIILFSCTLFLLVGCRTIELNSSWRDREITVDGASSDWLGALTYIEEPDISVGLLNDEESLFICLLAETPFSRDQIMRQGFIVWFDPTGGKEKNFGIRFPLGMEENLPPKRMGEEDFRPRMERDEEEVEDLLDFFQKSMTELEILGPKKDDKQKMLVAEAKGIEVSLVPSSGMLTYEMRVPLSENPEHPYAINSQPGKTMSIGFETPKLDLEKMRRGMGPRIPGGGGMPGIGRMPGGGMGGGMMRPQLPDEIKLWLKVQIANAPNVGKTE